MSRKPKKIKDLNQIDGKVQPETEQFEPTTLEQLWGNSEDAFSRYKTIDREEYKEQLTEMSTSDLRAHATSLQIIPPPNRERLVKRLLNEFSKHTQSFRKPKHTDVNSTKKTSKAVLDILKEAKELN